MHLPIINIKFFGQNLVGQSEAVFFIVDCVQREREDDDDRQEYVTKMNCQDVIWT